MTSAGNSVPSARKPVQFELPALQTAPRPLAMYSLNARQLGWRDLRCRQQHVHIAAEDVDALVAEHALGRGVELTNRQVVIHRHDGVVGRFEDRALPRFALDPRAVDAVGQVKRRRREEHRRARCPELSVTATTT